MVGGETQFSQSMVATELSAQAARLNSKECRQDARLRYGCVKLTKNGGKGTTRIGSD